MVEQVFIDQRAYYAESLGELLEKYSFFEKAKNLFDIGQDEQLNNLENPGVQLTIVYANHLKTPSIISYEDNPKTYSANYKVYPPDSMSTERGDGILLTTSTILPGIKWADDFDKSISGSKPIIFAEACSKYNERKSIYDDSNIL